MAAVDMTIAATPPPSYIQTDESTYANDVRFTDGIIQKYWQTFVNNLQGNTSKIGKGRNIYNLTTFPNNSTLKVFPKVFV